MKFTKKMFFSAITAILCGMMFSLTFSASDGENCAMDSIRPGLSNNENQISCRERQTIEQLLDDELDFMNYLMSDILPDQGELSFDNARAYKIYYESTKRFSTLIGKSFDYFVANTHLWKVPIIDSNGEIVGSAEIINGNTIYPRGIPDAVRNTNGWLFLGVNDLGETECVKKALEILGDYDKIVELLRNNGITEGDVLNIQVVQINTAHSTVLYVVTNEGEYLIPVSISHLYGDEVSESKISTDDFLKFLLRVEAAFEAVNEHGEPLYGGAGIDGIVDEEGDFNNRLMWLGIIGGVAVATVGITIIFKISKKSQTKE